MASYSFNGSKDFVLVADRALTRKVYPSVQPGDLVVVSGEQSDSFVPKEFVLVTNNEEQWIERFWYGLPRRYKNISKISKIVMR